MRLFLSSAILALGLLAACGKSGDAPAPQPVATTTPPPPPPDMSSGGPAPTATATATTPPGPPPEPPWEWVAPTVPTTSSGCGTARADAVHVDYTTPSGRTYHVWGPTNYDPSKTYPVVMMFHGILTNGADFESWFKMEDYTQNEAFVVYPDAAGPQAYWDTSGTTDLVFFDEMVKQLGETYCINPSRILGFGFSWGGHFADHLGCARAGYVKAIMVGDGGPAADDRKHCGRLPVLVTTRTTDTDEPKTLGLQVKSSWTGLNTCGAAGTQEPQTSNGGEGMGYCETLAPCKSPGSLVYCEDNSTFGAGAPPEWNHTVREYYRAFGYQWFKSLP